MKHSISAVRFQRIYGSGAMGLYPTRDSRLISCDPWGSIFWLSNYFWTFVLSIGLSDGVWREEKPGLGS